MSASNGCSQQRMHLLHAAARYLQHGFDHGIVLRRAFGNAAVQFDMVGLRERRLDRSVDAVDRGIVELDGSALRNIRQPVHAALAQAPVHLQRRRLAAIGQRRRRLEFGDQELRLVDLRDHQDFAEPCGERRLCVGRLRDQRTRWRRRSELRGGTGNLRPRACRTRRPGRTLPPAPPRRRRGRRPRTRHRTRTRSTPRRRRRAVRA